MDASDELDAFRGRTRAWLTEHCPPSMRTPARDGADDVWGGRDAVFPSDEARIWLDRMAQKGWTAPTWPVEYGGGGLTHAEADVLDEEMRALACRTPLKSFGLWMLGPVLLDHGTEAQKREHLPPIARGQVRWCQGYSEPSAGSDLASLRTQAVRDVGAGGDDLVVTGQKIWTSHADQSDWIFCLVRTDASAPKHEGISFLLMDMRSPGVRTRPIRLISGASPFCEVFFDAVRVPVRNVVGEINAGWSVAKAVLAHERALISRVRDAAPEGEESLEQSAKHYVGMENGVLADPVLRDRITQANMDFLCSKLTLRRSEDARVVGVKPGPETSMLKLYGTELNKRRRELFVLIAGFQGIGWTGEEFTERELCTTRMWLRSRANSIEGGSSEIQLNIIAKRVLGLPD